MFLFGIKITMLSCLLVLVQTDGTVLSETSTMRKVANESCDLPPLFFKGPAPVATQWSWKWTCQEHQEGFIPVRVARPHQVPAMETLHLHRFEDLLQRPSNGSRDSKALAEVLISAAVAAHHEEWDWVGRCLDFLTSHDQPWPKSMQDQATVLEWLTLRYEGARLQSQLSQQGSILENKGLTPRWRPHTSIESVWGRHLVWDHTLAYERYHWSMLEGRPSDAMAYYREAQHFHSALQADLYSKRQIPRTTPSGPGNVFGDYRLGLGLLVLLLAGAWFRSGRRNEVRSFDGMETEDLHHEEASRVLMPSEESLSRLRSKNVFTPEDWESYKLDFEHHCPGYIPWVMSIGPGITQSELRTACMIRLGLTSREIARAQNIGVYGVAQARYRLRKRLRLSNRESIEEVLVPRN